MNDAYEKKMEGEVACNVLMDEASGAPSPKQTAAMSNSMSTASFRASSPTWITPTVAVEKLNLNSASPLESSVNTLTLAALYHSSRRSRNTPEAMKTQLPASTNLPPPPPLYSASGQQNNQSLQFSDTPSAQPNQVSINTLHDSWNTSMSSLMNSSFFTSSNISALATNPPIGNTSPRQQRPRAKKNAQNNIDWSKLNNYSMEERAEPSFSNLPAPEGDDSSASAPFDDTEYSHVRCRSDFEMDMDMDIICDQEQEKTSRPGPNECNTTELPPPPHKRNRRGSYERTTPFPTNDVPATPMPRSSDTAFDIYVTNNPSSRVSSIFDDDINLTPLFVHARSRNQEKPPTTSRRKSLEIEDLEEEQPSRPMIHDHHGVQDSQSEKDQLLVRRKIQRLLLIRHCTKCSIRSIPLPPLTFPSSSSYTTPGGYFCPVSSHCAEGKALCAHIKSCKLDDCTYKKCLTTREVLGHYMKCRDSGCKVCGQVRSRDKRRRNQMKGGDDGIDIEWLHANMLL